MRLIDADNLEECKEMMTTIDGESKYAVRMDDIRNMPTIVVPTAELDTTKDSGEWEKYGDKIEAYDIAGHKTWGQKRRCTKCGFIKTYIEDFGIYPFCPNCSALMWKEGERNG